MTQPTRDMLAGKLSIEQDTPDAPITWTWEGDGYAIRVATTPDALAADDLRVTLANLPNIYARTLHAWAHDETESGQLYALDLNGGDT